MPGGINDHLPTDATGATWGPPIGGGFPTAEIAVHVHQITVKLDAWYAANSDRIVSEDWSAEVQAWLRVSDRRAGGHLRRAEGPQGTGVTGGP